MGVFNLRLNDNIHEKVKFIAKKQDRSQNKQVEYIIKQFIADYEKVNGEIKITDINE